MSFQNFNFVRQGWKKKKIVILQQYEFKLYSHVPVDAMAQWVRA